MMLISPQGPRRYRAIFISDIHLGTRRAQTQALLDFLRVTESDQLYIVGDFIDNWSLALDAYILLLTVLSPKAFRNAH
jgi:UDP-2,3-diacylglucosamine pyrophosphatase LpxH